MCSANLGFWIWFPLAIFLMFRYTTSPYLRCHLILTPVGVSSFLRSFLWSFSSCYVPNRIGRIYKTTFFTVPMQCLIFERVDMFYRCKSLWSQTMSSSASSPSRLSYPDGALVSFFYIFCLMLQLVYVLHGTRCCSISTSVHSVSLLCCKRSLVLSFCVSCSYR